MVSISIMALVTTVIVVRQSSFNGAVLLRNQAYEVAFAIRQAQLLAVSGGDDAARVYGVYFSTTAGLNQEYRMFRDSVIGPNADQAYDPSEQIGLTGRLDRRFMIRNLAVNSTAATDISLVFERPNFDALVCASGDCSGGMTPASNIFIDVAKVGTVAGDTDIGDVRRVRVSATGEIGVVTYP